jgi:hypothetical protein
MSDRLLELAGRKELLIARSRLHRVELQHGIIALRESFFQPKSMLSMATSGPVRPLLFSALMMLVGRGRFGGVVRGALAALTVVKAVRSHFGARSRR